MSASIAHIADGHTLGAGQSFLSGEHCVPAGSTVLELKQCENCVRVFVRSRCVHDHSPERKCECPFECDHPRIPRRCGCIKFCGQCRANALMPQPLIDEYREMLPPNSGSPRAIRYDQSLISKEKKSKWAGWNEGWQKTLIMRLSEGPVSACDLVEITGSQSKYPSSILVWLRERHGMSFEIVGHVWPRTQRCGPPRVLYALQEWKRV